MFEGDQGRGYYFFEFALHSALIFLNRGFFWLFSEI